MEKLLLMCFVTAMLSMESRSWLLAALSMASSSSKSVSSGLYLGLMTSFE